MPKFTSGHSVIVPLDVDNNIIRMKVRINGSRPLTMIFDTGASMTLIDDKLMNELGLKPTGTTLRGSGTGGSFGGSFLGNVTLAVDGVEVADQPLAAYPQNAPPGFEFDGIIGYDFIKAFVVEIDYDKKTMRLTDPASFRYRGKGIVIPLDLVARKTPIISTRLSSGSRLSLAARLELDSGFDAVFSLGGRFVREKGLIRYFKHGAESSANGAGGTEGRVFVNFDRAGFGGFGFTKVPVALSLGTTGADADTTSDGVIGGEILRRFRLVIDYSRNRLIMEKNSHFGEPFDLDDTD